MENKMKRIVLITALLLGWINTFGQGSGGIEGKWLGTIEVSGMKLRFLLKVEKAADGYTAKFDSIDQGQNDLAIDSITLSGNTVTFSAPQFGMSYEGTVNEKNDEIQGVFKRSSGATLFVLKRTGEIAMAERSQDPKKPYPYEEEEVSYKNTTDNVKLTGTLTTPNGTGKYPAVILISGSGSQNRDSFIGGHRPFLVLADHLTRKGIAVLRVDDRGMGGSDLGSPSVTSENFMLDVLAGFDFLKGRPTIDSKKIGLIGHSEGGMIAPMAAARSKDIAFIVMLAGLGQRGEDIIYTQTGLIAGASGVDAETIKRSVTLSRRINAIVKSESNENRIEQLINDDLKAQAADMSEDQRKAFAPEAAGVRAAMPMYKLQWYRYFIMFDPVPVLKKVKVPVLALNGELDLQVASKENLGLIAAGLKAGRNKDFTVKAFPKLNHLFQTSNTGLPSEYMTLDETFSPDVLNTISTWIAQRTTSGKP